MAKASPPPSLVSRWRAQIDDYVNALAWSPDSSELAAASVSGPLTIFDAASGAIKRALKGHSFGTTSLSWQPGGRSLASSGQDGKARIWDVDTGAELAALDAGAPWVERVAWSPSGEWLVTAAGKKLRLWNAKGELVRAFADESATIADVKWGDKAGEFASAGYGGVAFWNISAEQPSTRFAWKGSVLALAWSPNGKFIVGGAQDASVHFWYTADGKDLEMSGYPQKVRELSWDPTSTLIATGGGNQITIWNCSGKGPAGTAPIGFELHQQPLTGLVFQNRGQMLASACSEGRIALWLPGGRKKTLAQTKVDQGVSSLLWAPNDQRLAAGGEGGFVGVWAV
jgi:WD40 repeat protein